MTVKMSSKRGAFAGRRAQITVFMIVGIILLFSSALLFYIRGQIVEGIPEEFIPTIEEVPLEAQPVKVFVEDCMKRMGEVAFRQAGLHAGYIDPSDSGMSGREFMVGIEPTESDALMMMGSDNSRVPYWWYLKSRNTCSGNCEFGSLRPALGKGGGDASVEAQVDRYIERNLNACLQDFSSFRDQGFTVTVMGPMKSDVRVAEKEVILLLDYPISVELQGRKTDISQFYTKLDLNFKEIYNFATEITNSEIEMFFLELHTMDLISMYSWPSSMEKLPPIADVKIGLGDYRIWTRAETQRKMESFVLPPGIAMLQIDQSRDFSRRIMLEQDSKGNYAYDRVAQGLADKTIVALNNTQEFRRLAADFTYLDWWPIYLNINNQEVVGPRSVQGFDILSFIGVNEYRTWYDVSFPVMVTVMDSDAFAGKGYTFRFALEANIRENNHTSPTYVNLAQDSGKKLACNLNQRNSGIYDIETVDSVTGEPVTARVDFVLGNEACFVGFTSPDGENRTRLVAPLPVGFGALRANNESYLMNEQRMFTSDGVGGNMTVRMMPYRFINASVFARGLSYDVMSAGYVLPGGAPPSALSPQAEKAMLMFKRVDDDVLSGFTTFLIAYNSSSTSVLKIVPGRYEVSGYIFYESKTNPIRIPEEHITYEVPFSDDVTVDLNESLFDQYQKGGMILDNETGYLEITEDQLFGSDRVVFYLLRFPPPITHSEGLKNAPGLEQLGKLKEYSAIYKEQLQPDWLT
ncbi:hypothetical protein JW898_01315 [Candidatus Woesearchaeota archaeon]|nr:hypothetical protein [Candidatus Woesearchaeota archaeon]